MGGPGLNQLDLWGVVYASIRFLGAEYLSHFLDPPPMASDPPTFAAAVNPIEVLQNAKILGL